MSVVRYVNKKTGRVSLYESTSHYDPVAKQSRPIRTYIGYEDPVTGEFVQSSGKPGRKAKRNEPDAANPSGNAYYKGKYEQALAELETQRKENQELRKEIRALSDQIDSMRKAANAFIRAING